MRRYFRVTCKHGHFGAKRYQPISFVFLAKDLITAMDLAKAMPGVKHTDTILSCREISYAEYMNERKKSAYLRMNSFERRTDGKPDIENQRNDLSADEGRRNN